MVCYAVPLTASFLIFAGRKRFHREDEKSFRLGLLMAGGATFGVVDHAWNGQLALVGPNWVSDLFLGITITAVIFGGWLLAESLAGVKQPAAAKNG